ncbi:MAG TPA: cupin domain-containing protein [Chthonomonadales bacterium]|nr:cupin domain-containing protein [Chthonomonadales bacterium]
MDVVNRGMVDPFTTKDGSTIREILAPRNSRITRQSLAEATLPPGCATTPHAHPIAEEIYYVLAGHGRMTMEGEVRSVGQGDGIAIPPGAVHTLANTGASDLVFLCCCVPAYTHEDTVLQEERRAVGQPAEAADRRGTRP